MDNTYANSSKYNSKEEFYTEHPLQTVPEGWNIGIMLKRLRGGFFVVIGFLLSPMSWWNDLFFNLPIAYGFGYLCSLLHSCLNPDHVHLVL